jgi:hypothetical protein
MTVAKPDNEKPLGLLRRKLPQQSRRFLGKQGPTFLVKQKGRWKKKGIVPPLRPLQKARGLLRFYRQARFHKGAAGLLLE